jgi:hypothetical protein
VEGAVEHGDVRELRQCFPGAPELGQRRCIVERRKLGDGSQRGLDLIVDDHRLLESQAAVNDSMRNASEIAGRLVDCSQIDRFVIGADDGELDAGRAGVDDEDPAQ